MTPGTPAPTGHRTLLAVVLSVVFVAVAWATRFGGWSLLFVPLLALWVVNVHLGGRLNDSPLDAVGRVRAAKR